MSTKQQYPGQQAEKEFKSYRDQLKAKYDDNYKLKATDKEFDKLNELRLQITAYNVTVKEFLDTI